MGVNRTSMDICKWNIALNQEVALTTKQDAAFPTSNRRSQIAVFMYLKNTEENSFSCTRRAAWLKTVYQKASARTGHAAGAP